MTVETGAFFSSPLGCFAGVSFVEAGALCGAFFVADGLMSADFSVALEEELSFCRLLFGCSRDGLLLDSGFMLNDCRNEQFISG